MKKILLLFSLLVLLLPNTCMALNEVNIYFFHSDSCDICKQEEAYLKALEQKYPNIRVYKYETGSEDNYNLMLEARALFSDSRKGVPFTVIADTPYHGFNESVKCSMRSTIYKASYNAYENKLGKKLNISYKNDLEGEVEEPKEKENYTVEEQGTEGVHPEYKEEESFDAKKYKASIVLVGVGLILAIIYLFIKLLERRGRL